MRPLEVRRKALDRCAHRMAALDRLGIAFIADGTYSWHNRFPFELL